MDHLLGHIKAIRLPPGICPLNFSTAIIIMVQVVLVSASRVACLESVTRSNTTEPVFILPHRACYFTTWSRYRPVPGKYLPANVDPNLCTILIYAFGQITNNTISTRSPKDEDNFKELIALRRQHPDFKVILSVGGWTLSSQFPPMASSAESRRAFVASCVTNLRQWGLDGLDLDWEYPTAAEKTNFAALITELRAAFDEESARTGRVRLTLGAAVAAVSTKGYDITTMAENLDLVNVMTYNFHGSQRRPKLTGHSSPLYPSNSDRPHYSTSGAMEAWANLGIPKSKLLVGLSFYGNTWSLTNASDHGLGAAANGPAPAGPITRKAGVLAYNEICGLVQSGQLKRVMDAKSGAPYALGGTTWVSYDDTESIRGKAKWIMTNDFAGAFVWEISFDDFAGQCGSSKALLTALKDGLGQSANHINPSAATHTQ